MALGGVTGEVMSGKEDGDSDGDWAGLAAGGDARDLPGDVGWRRRL